MVAFKATKALVLFCCIADIFLLSDASDTDRQCGNSSDYQRDIAAKSGEQLRFGNCTTLLAKDSVEKMELWVHIPPKLTHYRLFACENNCTERKDGFKEVNLSENVTVTFSVTFPKSLEGHVKICGEVTISQAFPDQPKCYQLLLKYVPYRGYQQQISTLFNILFEAPRHTKTPSLGSANPTTAPFTKTHPPSSAKPTTGSTSSRLQAKIFVTVAVIIFGKYLFQ